MLSAVYNILGIDRNIRLNNIILLISKTLIQFFLDKNVSFGNKLI